MSNESMMTMLMAMMGAYLVVGVIWVILQVIAYWRIFKKAGEPGWKSLIPVYSGYVQYKIAWKPMMFWIMLIATFIGNYTYNNYLSESSTMWMVITLILGVVCLIINIMYSVKLAKAFGKGIGFAVGLLLLQPIFILILAFGSAEYQGADL